MPENDCDISRLIAESSLGTTGASFVRFGYGFPLAILYVRDTVSNPAGCAADRCRRIVAVELK